MEVVFLSRVVFTSWDRCSLKRSREFLEECQSAVGFMVVSRKIVLHPLSQNGRVSHVESGAFCPSAASLALANVAKTPNFGNKTPTPR